MVVGRRGKTRYNRTLTEYNGNLGGWTAAILPAAAVLGRCEMSQCVPTASVGMAPKHPNMVKKQVRHSEPPSTRPGGKDFANLRRSCCGPPTAVLRWPIFSAKSRHLLLDFSASDAVELWVKREDYMPALRGRPPPGHSFRMETKPLAALLAQARGAKIRAGSLVLPVMAAGETVGLLQLKSRRKDCFPQEDVESYEDVSQALGLTLVSQLAHAALRERVKELTCLYSLAQLVEHPEVTSERCLRGIVEMLPPAWQYPEITVGADRAGRHASTRRPASGRASTGSRRRS